jgi:hypothetical protein
MSLLDNLVAHYKFNDLSGTTVVNSVGLPNGVSANAVTPVAGKVDGALSFNGTSDYVDTGQTFQATFRSDFTISLWVKPDEGQPTENNFFLGETKGAYSDMVELEIVSSILPYAPARLMFNYYANYNTNPAYLNMLSELGTFSAGPQGWHNIIIEVYQNGSKISGKIYLDGTLYMSATSSSNGAMSGYSADRNLALGCENDSRLDLYGFNHGPIDDVMIFNRRLTAAERSILWNNGNGTEDLSDEAICDIEGSA